MDLLSPMSVSVSVAAMFLGGAAAGAAGFGMGMVALPFMLLVLDPVTAVLALNTTQVLLFLMILRHTRSQVQTREAKPMALLGVAGAAVGVFTLTASAEAAIRLTAVSLVLVLSVMTAAAPTLRFQVPSRVGPPLGFAAAVLLGAMAIGGPVMALYALGRGWAKNSVRGTLAFYFLAVTAVLAVGYAAAELYSAERWVFIGIAQGPVLVGALVGTRLAQFMSEHIFRKSVLALIIASSLAVLVRELAA